MLTLFASKLYYTAIDKFVENVLSVYPESDRFEMIACAVDLLDKVCYIRQIIQFDDDGCETVAVRMYNLPVDPSIKSQW